MIMKKLLVIILSLFCLPAFAQDRGQRVSEFTTKISNKIQSDCSQQVFECGKKIQELASQQKDITEQVKICSDLGQQVGSCFTQRMGEFTGDLDKLNVHDPNFDRDFDQLVQKWDK
jgi:hypothetical protein